MSIRIGNTVYIGGNKYEVEPRVASDWFSLSESYELTEETLADLKANKPGGIIRVKARKN